MKRIIHFFLFACLFIILWGCPYDSPFGLDEEAQQPIDEKLLGTWGGVIIKPANDGDYKQDSLKIIFERFTDKEYNISITGNLQELKPFHVVTKDSIHGTAFISSAEGKVFLNAFIKSKMYVAEISLGTNGLSLFCLSEHFTGKYIKNSAELRKAISFHYRVSASPAYDDFFVIRNLQKEP